MPQIRNAPRAVFLTGCSLLLGLLSCLPAAGQQTWRELLGEAGRLRAEMRYAQAADVYQKALPLCADDRERLQVWYGLASVYRSQRNREQALRAYQEVTRLKDVPPDLVLSAWQQIANLHIEAEEWEEARAAYERLSAEFPDSPEVRVSAGMDLAGLDVLEDKAPAAVRRLRDLIAAYPDSPRAPELYGVLVHAQIMAGDLNGATATARDGWERYPDSPMIVLSLIESLREAGLAPQAIPLAWELVARQPEDDRLFQALVDLHRETRSLPQMLDWLEQQAKTAEQRAIWLRRLAQLYREERLEDQAVGVYERLLVFNPTDSALLREAGMVALEAGELVKAEKWLRQCLALSPGDEGLIIALGEIYLGQGRPDEAMRFWREGYHYEPGDRSATARFAGTLQRHGLGDEALAVYQEAREALGDPLAFSAQVGQIHEARLDYAGATREYVAALAGPDRAGQGLASMRLQGLVEDGTARPEVRAILEAMGPVAQLPPDAQAMLLLARVLDGDDPGQALAALPLTSASDSQLGLLARLGQKLEAGGQLRPAALAYGRVLEALPVGVQRLALGLHLADLQVQAGDWREALRTLEADPGAPLPPSLVRRAELARADILLRRARRPEAARALVAPWAGGGPDSETGLRARWLLADCDFAMGEHEAARRQYASLLAAQDPLPEAEDELPPLILGSFYLSLGHDALPRRLPGQAYVDFQQAEMLFREGKLAEARVAYQQVSATHVATPYANDALERVLLLQGMQPGAPGEEAFREAIKAFDRGDAKLATELLGGIKAPGLVVPASLLLADVQLWQGTLDEALATLARVGADYPDNPRAPEATLRHAALQLTTAPEAARTELEALITKYPDAPEAAEAQALLRSLPGPPLQTP